MSRISTALCIFLSFVLGTVFLFSGISKLYPIIETFEFSFIAIGVADWYTAPILARVFIAFELFLGLLLVANYNLKKFTIPISIAFLGVLTVYLIIMLVSNGNKGNCACFGEWLPMTPLQAILKNAVMIIFSLLLYFNWKGWSLSNNRLTLVPLGIVFLIIPFATNPLDFSYTSNNLDEKINYPLALQLLYNTEDSSKVVVPAINLYEGKQIIAFLSLSCKHCRIAATKLGLMKRKNNLLPIYYVLNGDKDLQKDFLNETNSVEIPFSLCNGKVFVQLAGTQLPRIYFLEEGIIRKKADYFELNQYKIEHWLKTGQLR